MVALLECLVAMDYPAIETDGGIDKNKKKREVIFTRAEKYVKEYRDAEVRFTDDQAHEW